MAVKSKKPTIVMDGKIPPHDKEAESIILGSIMADKYALATAMADLNPDYFYDPSNALIAGAIVELIKHGSALTPITVVDQLRKSNQIDTVGGPMAVSRLMNSYTSSVTLPEFISIVKRHWLSRELHVLGMQVAGDAMQNNSIPTEIVEYLQTKCLTLTSSVVKSTSVTARDLLPKVLEEIKSRQGREKQFMGAASGFYEIDKLFAGFRPGRFYVLGGRPAMGKTTLAINFAWRSAFHHNSRVLFISLEMTSAELVQKMLAMVTGSTGHQIDAGLMEKHELDRLALNAPRAGVENLVIDDASALTPLLLRSKIFEMKMKRGGCDLVIVDYLQLMSSGNKIENKNQEVTEISRALKVIAKEMAVPIIALSQLSRDVENEPAKRPKLKHLRESGAIEQDADAVMFIYRPGYYGLKDDHGEPIDGRWAELIVAKHRGGALADIALMAILDASRIYGRKENDPDHFEGEFIYTGSGYQDQQF